MNNALPKKSIMFVAGEISGDINGAYLLKAIQEENKDYSLSFFGIGGPKMKKEGLKNPYDLTGKSTIGIFEVIRYFPQIYKAYNYAKKLIKKEQPDLLVLIDYQGFNMILAKYAKKNNIRVIYYITPQEWLWGTERGGKNVAKNVDKLITIFKNEDDFYKNIGANAEYVGHPMLDIVNDYDKSCNLKKSNEDIIGLFPGSRHQEIDYILPIMLDIVKKVKDKKNNVKFIISLSSDIFLDKIKQKVIESGLQIDIIQDKSKEIINNSKFILTASGTVTLEAALLEKPMIVLYKLSKLSYYFARYFMNINMPFISLPNILLNKMAVPEYVQNKININDIISKTLQLLDDKKLYDDIIRDLKKVKGLLGEKGAVNRASNLILKELKL